MQNYAESPKYREFLTTNIHNLSVDDFVHLYLLNYLQSSIVTILPFDLVSYEVPRITLHNNYTTRILNLFELDEEFTNESTFRIKENLIIQSNDNDIIDKLCEECKVDKKLAEEFIKQPHPQQQEQHNNPLKINSTSSFRLTPVYFEHPIPPPPSNIQLNEIRPWCRAWVPIDICKYSKLSNQYGQYYRYYRYNDILYVSVIVTIRVQKKADLDTSSSTDSVDESILWESYYDHNSFFLDLLHLYGYSTIVSCTIEWYNNDISPNIAESGLTPSLLYHKLMSLQRDISYPPPIEISKRNCFGYIYDRQYTSHGIRIKPLIDNNLLTLDFLRILTLGYGNDQFAERIWYTYKQNKLFLEAKMNNDLYTIFYSNKPANESAALKNFIYNIMFQIIEILYQQWIQSFFNIIIKHKGGTNLNSAQSRSLITLKFVVLRLIINSIRHPENPCIESFCTIIDKIIASFRCKYVTFYIQNYAINFATIGFIIYILTFNCFHDVIIQKAKYISEMKRRHPYGFDSDDYTYEMKLLAILDALSDMDEIRTLMQEFQLIIPRIQTIVEEPFMEMWKRLFPEVPSDALVQFKNIFNPFIDLFVIYFAGSIPGMYDTFRRMGLDIYTHIPREPDKKKVSKLFRCDANYFRNYQ